MCTHFGLVLSYKAVNFGTPSAPATDFGLVHVSGDCADPGAVAVVEQRFISLQHCAESSCLLRSCLKLDDLRPLGLLVQNPQHKRVTFTQI
jgi:hypothetical protein